MIVPMLKFELCALSSERKKLLNALQKTQLVEPVFPEEDGLEACPKGDDALQEKLSKVTKAIAFFTEQADTVQQKDKAFRASLSDTILLKYDEFAAAASREEELMALVGRAEAWSAALASIRAARNKAAARKAQLMPYLAVGEAFSAFRDTANTACFFGLIDIASLPALQAYAKEEPLSALTVYEGAKQVPVALFCHRSVAAAAAIRKIVFFFIVCFGGSLCFGEKAIHSFQGKRHDGVAASQRGEQAFPRRAADFSEPREGPFVFSVVDDEIAPLVKDQVACARSDACVVARKRSAERTDFFHARVVFRHYRDVAFGEHFLQGAR